MRESEYLEWLATEGQVVVPLALLNNLQSLNLSPENLGYLILAMAHSKKILSSAEIAKNPWIKWSLAEGWARWVREGEDKRISFVPLWNNLYYLWEKQQKAEDISGTLAVKRQSEFDYSKIIKWLDQTRGTLSVTFKEKQLLQEFNVRYGWSTDFILIFLQLCFERGQNTLQKYQPIAKKVYTNGVHTVDELVSFMNDLDWIQYKVSEVKKCVGQYGGVTRPQREMYLKWHQLWKFSHEVIMRAAEETVRTNNPSFKYIEGILQDWQQKGVKNLQDAELALQQHDQRKKGKEKKQGFTKDANKKRISRTDNRDWEKMLGIE
ncbi:MAG: DnaD domain protein [Clostridia bacterium]|nr:DnaD domain protein [Clostridia bacterium]